MRRRRSTAQPRLKRAELRGVSGRGESQAQAGWVDQIHAMRCQETQLLSEPTLHAVSFFPFPFVWLPFPWLPFPLLIQCIVYF